MPELSQKERLQLSLLDRLTDDEPTQLTESRGNRVITVTRLKELVQRDLAWLLNSVAAGTSIDLVDYPEIQTSGINFGIPDLSGSTATSLNVKALERELAKCIRCFEPRIIPHSLDIKVNLAAGQMGGNTLSMEINADIWAQPLPLQLFLQTDIDIENGIVSISQWH